MRLPAKAATGILTKYKINKSVTERSETLRVRNFVAHANKCADISRLRICENGSGTCWTHTRTCTHARAYSHLHRAGRTIFVTLYWDEHVVVATFTRSVTQDRNILRNGTWSRQYADSSRRSRETHTLTCKPQAPTFPRVDIFFTGFNGEP